MKGINDILKDRILQTFRAVQSEEKWKVCVVDSKSMKILSAACKLANLFEMDIVSIDNIDKPRQSHPKLEAIYILTPCLDSIQRLVNDFSKSEGPMYKCAHVHFTGALDGSLFSDMNRRVTEAGVAKYIRALKEIFVDFLAVDSATYTTDYSFQTPANFFTCFGTTEYNRAEEDLKDIAKQLLAVCAVLGENPMIRYHRPLDLEGVENRYLPSKLAKALQSELDEFVRQNPEFPPSRDPPVGPATMFILDRTIDSCSPFLHELTYQAMMNDLLNLENNGTKYSYEYNEEESGVTTTVRKDVVLDESDNVFVEVRHLYIQEAIDKLTTEFRELIGKGGIAKTGDSLKDLNAMKDVVARLPQYQEMKAKYGVHLDIAQKCIDIFTQQELRSIVELEQDLACGETHDGHTLKNIVDRMTPFPATKTRLIAIYMASNIKGAKEEDKKVLLAHARLGAEHKEALENLSLMGIQYNETLAKLLKKPKAKRKQFDADSVMLTRYQPRIKGLLEDHLADDIDNSLFPFLKHPLPASRQERQTGSHIDNTLRVYKTQWHKKTKGQAVVKPPDGPAMLVFVLGGITWSEIRSAFEIAQQYNREVYIGSTHILTPESYLHDLQMLRKPIERPSPIIPPVQSGPATKATKPRKTVNPTQPPRSSSSGIANKVSKFNVLRK